MEQVLLDQIIALRAQLHQRLAHRRLGHIQLFGELLLAENALHVVGTVDQVVHHRGVDLLLQRRSVQTGHISQAPLRRT